MSNTIPTVPTNLHLPQHPLPSYREPDTSESPPQIPTAETSPQPQAHSRGPQPHACTLCQQRKVRCDRRAPCSGCSRLRVPCVFRAPAPPRRRQKRESRVSEAQRGDDAAGSHINGEDGDKLGKITSRGGSGNDVALWADFYEKKIKELERKVGRYEGMLKQLGVDLENCAVPRSEKVEAAKEYTFVGGSKPETSALVENHLWSTLTDEIQDSNEVFQDSNESAIDNDTSIMPNSSDSEAVLFNIPDTHIEIPTLYPPSTSNSRLWQTYRERVHPLLMLFHAPTVEQQLSAAVADLDGTSASLHALIFAIFSCSIASLDDNECPALFGEEKQVLLTRYQSATQQALVRARLLKTSELVVLQAFTLYLISTRPQTDPRSLWTLIGIAVRTAQRLGLHRDPSLLPRITPFDAEIRRRLWWQIMMLDGVTSEQAGTGLALDLPSSSLAVARPLNVNDADLYPTMPLPPTERKGATEMMFVLERCEIGDFLHRPDGGMVLGSKTVSVAEKDKAIDALERTFQDGFLRYTDPLEPLHMMVTGLARAAVCKLRLMAHYPRQYNNVTSSSGFSSTNPSDTPGACPGKTHRPALPLAERELLFTTSLRLIEYDNLAHSHTPMRRYLWHVDVHLQWHALIYLLAELRAGGTMLGAGGGRAEMEKAWRAIMELMGHRREIAEGGSALYVAVGWLALEAWERWEGIVGVHGGKSDAEGDMADSRLFNPEIESNNLFLNNPNPAIETPPFVKRLRQRKLEASRGRETPLDGRTDTTTTPAPSSSSSAASATTVTTPTTTATVDGIHPHGLTPIASDATTSKDISAADGNTSGVVMNQAIDDGGAGAGAGADDVFDFGEMDAVMGGHGELDLDVNTIDWGEWEALMRDTPLAGFEEDVMEV